MIDEPASKGDVIAIVALIGASIFGILLSPWAANAIDNFEVMFRSLKAELPGITKLVLRFGWLGGSIISPLLAVGGWVFYAKSKSLEAKVGVSLAALLITWSIFGCIVLGVFRPILEMQKQLS